MKNSNFKKLTKSQQRVAVAKDALKQIKIGRYYIDPYSVFTSPGIGTMLRKGEVSYEDELQKVLVKYFKKSKKNTCEVCQRGALLTSLVRLDNNFLVNQRELGGMFSVYSTTDKRLMKVFEAEQLELVEQVLMNPKGHKAFWLKYLPKVNREVFLEEYATGCKITHKQSEKIAVAILKNMVRNNGTFKERDI